MGTDRAFTREEVAAILDACWRRILRFPRAQVCRHWAALQVMAEMERIGCQPPNHVIRAVVESDDETALEWQREQSEAA